MEKREYTILFQFEDRYWWYQGLHELIEYYVIKFKANENLKIFDGGCGTGKLMEILSKYGSVEGIDYYEEAISFCRERGLKNAAVGDLNNWKPVSNFYDIITSIDVICHSAISDDIDVLKKFHFALKTGGILILNLPAFNFLKRMHDIAVYTKRRYIKSMLVQNLDKIGFKVITATYRLPLLFFVMFVKKYIEKLFNKKNVESDLKFLPSFINGAFLQMNRFENKIITKGINIPFGSSLFIVAKK